MHIHLTWHQFPLTNQLSPSNMMKTYQVHPPKIEHVSQPQKLTSTVTLELIGDVYETPNADYAGSFFQYDINSVKHAHINNRRNILLLIIHMHVQDFLSPRMHLTARWLIAFTKIELIRTIVVNRNQQLRNRFRFNYRRKIAEQIIHRGFHEFRRWLLLK